MSEQRGEARRGKGAKLWVRDALRLFLGAFLDCETRSSLPTLTHSPTHSLTHSSFTHHTAKLCSLQGRWETDASRVAPVLHARAVSKAVIDARFSLPLLMRLGAHLISPIPSHPSHPVSPHHALQHPIHVPRMDFAIYLPPPAILLRAFYLGASALVPRTITHRLTNTHCLLDPRHTGRTSFTKALLGLRLPCDNSF
jgi:hypothetical protein